MEHMATLVGPRKLRSIFFGGGTPSLMSPKTVEALIEAAQSHWPDEGVEITCEANPNSVEAQKFRDFKSAGVNRVSLGIQSLNPSALQFLGRTHSKLEAIEAIEIARNTFDRYSFDLIYTRPDQKVQEWQQELQEALSIAGDHLSLYQLTIEEGTVFHTLFSRGQHTLPEEETSAQLFEITQDIMNAHGLPAYEISNHAREGQECQHNLQYWQYRDYVGIGPGAHGRITLDGKKYATRCHRAPETWTQKVQQQNHGIQDFISLSWEVRFQELVMMGLRLQQGISKTDFSQELGKEIVDVWNNEILQPYMTEGLLEMTPTHMRATPKGLQKLNALTRALLGEVELKS